MASITMSASFLSTSTLAKHSPVATNRRLVITSAAKAVEVEGKNDTKKQATNNGKRDLMLAMAAAAICSAAGVAVAEEPKPGTPEARKTYAPVCVTMPTARICRK